MAKCVIGPRKPSTWFSESPVVDKVGQLSLPRSRDSEWNCGGHLRDSSLQGSHQHSPLGGRSIELNYFGAALMVCFWFSMVSGSCIEVA